MEDDDMAEEYDFSNAKRGPVLPLPSGKVRITIRLDEDIVDWFRAQVDAVGGGSYQALINDTLREAMHRNQEALEDTLRRVIREELAAHATA